MASKTFSLSLSLSLSVSQGLVVLTLRSLGDGRQGLGKARLFFFKTLLVGWLVFSQTVNACNKNVKSDIVSLLLKKNLQVRTWKTNKTTKRKCIAIGF